MLAVVFDNYLNIFLADVFDNFRDTCLKIYELDSTKFLSVPGLSWQAA